MSLDYGKRYPNVNEHGKALRGTQTQAKTSPVRVLVRNGIPISRRGEKLLREFRGTKPEALNPNTPPQDRA